MNCPVTIGAQCHEECSYIYIHVATCTSRDITIGAVATMLIKSTIVDNGSA